jgi:hypothetical protein
VDWIQPEEFFADTEPESSLINLALLDEARATRRAAGRVAPAPVKATTFRARWARRRGAIRRSRLNCRTGAEIGERGQRVLIEGRGSVWGGGGSVDWTNFSTHGLDS